MAPEKIAEVLNGFFASLFPAEKDPGDFPSALERTVKLEHTDIKEEDVLGNLESINLVNFLTGQHRPQQLWETREEISEPLAMILESSVETEQFTEYWRVAVVASFFKRGNRMSPGNY